MGQIKMAQRELHRIQLLTLVLEGELGLAEAAQRLGLSTRQAGRLKARLARKGPQSLAHGNRGRPPPNRTDPELERRILELAAGPYGGFNDCHLLELLAERERITIGRETLRRLLRRNGRPAKRRRRPKKHHRRRERAPTKGLMLLWDGSPHRWFGPKRPSCTLMAAVDDADSELVGACFCPAETTDAYLRLLQDVLRRRGVPLSIYMDRHSALKRNDSYWSLEEELAGRQSPTQVGRALEELGIQPIYALSAQAKGRVERFFDTAQDRLIAEMALDGITTPEAGNEYLRKLWIRRYNRRFKDRPASVKTTFRSTKGLPLKRILSFRYTATVSNDNVIKLGGISIQIPPNQQGRGYAKHKVDVRQHLDGSWSVYLGDRTIARAGPTHLSEPMRHRRKGSEKKLRKGKATEVLVYSPRSSPRPEDILAGQL